MGVVLIRSGYSSNYVENRVASLANGGPQWCAKACQAVRPVDYKDGESPQLFKLEFSSHPQGNPFFFYYFFSRLTYV